MPELLPFTRQSLLRRLLALFRPKLDDRPPADHCEQCAQQARGEGVRP